MLYVIGIALCVGGDPWHARERRIRTGKAILPSPNKQMIFSQGDAADGYSE